MATVSVHYVTKAYRAENSREILAVQDLSFAAGDRELAVLLGPAGCGKTTLLRMIAGLESVSKGEIQIGGKAVTALPAGERDVALVTRHGAVYPRMTVQQNLVFGVKSQKLSATEIKRRVTEAAGLLSIEALLDRRPITLTALECWRVALGRALVRQPKAFLFDEPLASFDVRTRAGLRAEIIKLHHELQATMICATGDPDEAMAVGERLVVMKEGGVQQIDTPHAVYREPANLFVAGLIGTPPMNLIRGKLREAGGALIFKEAGEGVLELKLDGRTEEGAAGREVIAGIRPEDVKVVAGEKKPTRFQCLVDIVEQSGGGANVHLQTGAHTLIARTEAAIGNEEAGHRAQFEIDPAKVCFYDPETTRRIAL